MITDNVKNINLYFNNFPFLKIAYEFINNNINESTAEQKYHINDDMYAVVETSAPKPAYEQKLEIHRKYIDLQYIIKCYDIIGWKSLRECGNIYAGYDVEKDIAFYNDKPDFNIKLNAGYFALFLPGDAHAPLCGDFPVKKCIIKINSELIKQ